MNKDKEICCIYARISTLDKQSTDRQLFELKQYAKSLNLKVDKIFEDKISGSVKVNERTGFINLTKYVKSNKINKILVWDISRIGRGNLNTLSIIDEFKQLGISFLTKNEGFDTASSDPRTNFHINIMTSFAQMEREELKARVISGVRTAIAKGHTAGFRVLPYGYKSKNKKLVIDEVESKVIQLIFSMYLEGFGTQKIANYMNNQKTPTRFNLLYQKKKNVRTRFGVEKKPSEFKWRDATVYGILKNTIYMGKRKVLDTLYDVDAIVSEDVFLEVQKQLSSHNNKLNSNRKYLNIFQGDKSKIICGSCGNGYFMHKRYSGKDTAYKCISKKLPEIICQNPSIGINKLNNVVYSSLYDTSFYDFQDENKNAKTKRLVNELEILEINLKQDSIELNSLITQKDKLLDVFLKEIVIESDYVQKNQKLEKKVKPYKSRIKKIESEIRYIKKHLDNIEKNDFFNYKNVEYFKINIRNYLNYIKIIDVSENKFVRTLYPKKHDVVILIEINNLINGLSVFSLLSQRERYYHKVFNSTNAHIPIETFEDTLSLDEGVFNAIQVKSKTPMNQDTELSQTVDSSLRLNKHIKFESGDVMAFTNDNFIYEIMNDLEYLSLEQVSIPNIVKID